MQACILRCASTTARLYNTSSMQSWLAMKIAFIAFVLNCQLTLQLAGSCVSEPAVQMNPWVPKRLHVPRIFFNFQKVCYAYSVSSACFL